MRRVLIIAGLSGVGKTVASADILERREDFTLLRSATTRPCRDDAHRDEYIYLTEEEFTSWVERGEMAEHMTYEGYSYGTPLSELERAFSEGRTPLLVLDLAGVRSLSERGDLQVCAVYIYDSLNSVEERLYNRYLSTPTVGGLTEFMKRKERNIRDYLALPEYGGYFYSVVLNDGTIRECADRILTAYESFSLGAPRQDDEIGGIIEALYRSAEEKA